MRKAVMTALLRTACPGLDSGMRHISYSIACSSLDKDNTLVPEKRFEDVKDLDI